MTTETKSVHHQEFVNFWACHQCPKCYANNWTYQSHSQRSEPDHVAEICQCRQCGNKYWLYGEDIQQDIYPGSSDPDGNNWGVIEEVGREYPL